MMTMTYHPRVRGYCPMGCGETLYLTGIGEVACRGFGCPRVFAAADLLRDRETDHVVVLRETEFTVRHPLRERIDDALMDCGLHAYIAGLDGPPRPPGRWRVRHDGGEWAWEMFDDEGKEL